MQRMIRACHKVFFGQASVLVQDMGKKKKEKRREKDGEKYMEGTTGNPPYGVAESFSDPRQADMDGSFTVSWA